MSIELEQTASEAITPEQLFECMGIEEFVTQDLARHVIEKKRAHVDAVLLEQRLQKQQGVRDPKKLSSVSQKSSCWTRNRTTNLQWAMRLHCTSLDSGFSLG